MPRTKPRSVRAVCGFHHCTLSTALSLYVCIHFCVCVTIGYWNPVELELYLVVSLLIWVFEIKARSSVRAVPPSHFLHPMDSFVYIFIYLFCLSQTALLRDFWYLVLCFASHPWKAACPFPETSYACILLFLWYWGGGPDTHPLEEQ